MDSLKECPACGSGQITGDSNGDDQHWYTCNGCGLSGPTASDLAAARLKWNALPRATLNAGQIHLNRCAAIRLRAIAAAMRHNDYGEYFHVRQSQEVIDDIERGANALYPEPREPGALEAGDAKH